MVGLGESLRAAREAQGFSLEEVERATKIRKRYLIALETEDYSALPAPVFARGFLRIYCHHLGLDPQPLLVQYPNYESVPPLMELPTLSAPSPHISTVVLVTLIMVATGLGGFFIARQSSSVSEAKPGFIEVSQSPPTAVPTPTVPLAPIGPFTLEPTPTSTPQATPTPRPSPTVTPIPTVSMPSVGSMSYADAEALLRGMGLGVNRQEDWNARVPKGIVYAQSPPADQSVAKGTTVILTVSKGARGIVVPDVKGMPEREAKQALINAGLRVSPWVNYQSIAAISLGDREWARQICGGCVLSTTPAAGAEVATGTEVSIAVRSD